MCGSSSSRSSSNGEQADHDGGDDDGSGDYSCVYASSQPTSHPIEYKST